jgi:transposase
MPRTGRPSKLTAERRDRFIDAIKIGNYVDTAASLAGISRSSVYSWMAKGREGSRGEYVDFLNAVKEAEAFAENSAVGQVRRAAVIPQNWTAAMTFLERRFRDRWARPAQVVADPSGSGRDVLPPGPPDLTDEPVVIPMADRLTGILDALAAAGKLDGHADGSGSRTLPVPGDGHRPSGNGTG